MLYDEKGGRHPTVTDKGIYGFFDDYRFLSNFHICDVYYKGFVYKSSEAAYMSCKSNDFSIKTQLASMSPNEAKKFGQTIELIPDWEYVRVLSMTEVVFAKFNQNQDLTERLINFTRNKYLEETNDWNDLFWGANSMGKGVNMLGKILMSVRDQLL